MVAIRDAAAYGLIVIQGWGSVGNMDVETPSLIRFGEMTKDELFVTAAAAQRGVRVTNRSDKENLVMLKHFGPGNPDAAPLVKPRGRGTKPMSKDSRLDRGPTPSAHGRIIPSIRHGV